MKKIMVIALMSLLAGCTWSTAGQFNAVQEARNEVSSENVNVAFDQSRYDHGQSVYLKQYCGTCHTLDTLKTRGTFGPAHNQLGVTAAQRIADESYRGKATDAYTYLSESLTDPNAYIVTGFEGTMHHMPAYTHLAAADLDNLVYFLAHQQ